MKIELKDVASIVFNPDNETFEFYNLDEEMLASIDIALLEMLSKVSTGPEKTSDLNWF